MMHFHGGSLAYTGAAIFLFHKLVSNVGVVYIGTGDQSEQGYERHFYSLLYI